MQRVDDYILQLTPDKKEIYIILRDFIRETVPEITERISYGIPFFYLNRPFAYLHQNKNDGVDLSFPSGHLLSNAHKALEKRDRKFVRTLHYKSVQDIDLEILKEVLLEASRINRGWKK